MMTLAQEWTERMLRDNAEPVDWLRIDLGGGQTRDFVKGWAYVPTLVLAPNSIAEVSPVASALDPVKREMKTDSVSVMFHADRAMRDLVISTRLTGKAATLKVGESGLLHSHFAPRFAGVIDEAPKVLNDGRVEMKISSAMSILRKAEVSGFWKPMHFLEAMESILLSALPAALYDATTLDPSNPIYDDISHWVIQRGLGNYSYVHDFGVGKPRKALELLEELATLGDGQFTQHEDGILRFLRFDPAAAVVATFTHENFDFESFETVATNDDMVNQISVSYARTDPDEYAKTYVDNDTTSQADHAFPGESERIVAEEYESHWLDSRGVLQSTIDVSDGPGDTFIVAVTHPGFCGLNYPSGFPGTSRPSWAEVTSSRTAFLAIGDELIEIDDVTVSTAYRTNRSIVDPQTGSTVEFMTPARMTCRILTRGACDTTPATHLGTSSQTTVVHDATIPVAMARTRLTRRSNGLAKIKLRAHPAQFYGVQVGDLVNVITDRYAAYGYDGLDEDTKWEVIGKEVSFDESAGAVFTLAWATHVTPPAPSFAGRNQRGKLATLGTLIAIHGDTGMAIEKYLTGGVVSNGGSLNANVAAFIWTSAAVTNSKPATVLAMTASRDNYIYLDCQTNAYVVKDVALATTEPDREQSLLALAMVKAGASTITSITDLRQTSGIVGGALKPSSVATGSIADGAVTTGKVADLAIETGKIAGGAVIDTKIGTGAVTTTKIAASAVIDTKIATGAVTNAKVADLAIDAPKVASSSLAPVHLATRTNLSSSIIPNSYFQHRTRG